MAVLEARAGGAGTSILDLDWRPVLWSDPADYAACMRAAARLADVALGGDEEIEAAVGSGGAGTLLDLGVRVVAQKHGPRGATLHMAGRHTARVAGQRVDGRQRPRRRRRLRRRLRLAAAARRRSRRAAEFANRAGAHVAGRLGCSIAMPEEGDLL